MPIDKFEKSFENFVETFEKSILSALNELHINTNEQIAVALSGGSDSLSLTIALKRCKIDILAIMVNHHLRNEADDEIDKTIKTLEKNNIKYVVKNWDGKYKKNLEAEARNARYNLLLNVCKEYNINALCIGHHIDDQAETFLLNLARGSGLDGLCAMPKITTIDGIKIVRPMLNLTKQDCKDYLTALNIDWCEDKSNADTKYKRNKLRMMLNEIEDKQLITKRIAMAVECLQEARETLDALLIGTENNLIKYTKNTAIFDRKKFLLLTQYLQKSILARIIMKIAEKEYKPRLYQIQNLLDTIKTEIKFKRTIANLVVTGNKDIVMLEKLK